MRLFTLVAVCCVVLFFATPVKAQSFGFYYSSTPSVYVPPPPTYYYPTYSYYQTYYPTYSYVMPAPVCRSPVYIQPHVYVHRYPTYTPHRFEYTRPSMHGRYHR